MFVFCILFNIMYIKGLFGRKKTSLACTSFIIHKKMMINKHMCEFQNVFFNNKLTVDGKYCKIHKG